MKRLKRFFAILCMRILDWLLDVTMDKPVYLIFLGEGQVQIQESNQPAKTIQL
jgi:hypothetical protein